MPGLLGRLLSGLKGKTPISYEEAKKQARCEDSERRRELAKRQDIEPEILYFLAEDPLPEVRREIAANQKTPRQADLMLANDRDEDVRLGLAAKISMLIPGLTHDEQDKIRKITLGALEILARDQAVRVRQIIAETLKDVANAPPAVIKRLANDIELVVSVPVLEFSPVLSDKDLLEIIASGPASGALGAISRRGAVGESLADAIFMARDENAIADLLSNRGAQIREETLDRIVGMAPDVEIWHRPLVKRPFLPSGAAARLARFVADNLVEILINRHDLDQKTAEEVKQVVHKRIEEGSLEGPKPKKEASGAKKKKTETPGEKPVVAASHAAAKAGETPLETAKRLRRESKLNETMIASSLNAGEKDFVKAAIAVLAGMQPSVIENIMSAQSARGIVAVAWKAGLSMKIAEQLQLKIARISPREMLGAAGGGKFPLSDEEMSWQLDFLSGL